MHERGKKMKKAYEWNTEWNIRNKSKQEQKHIWDAVNKFVGDMNEDKNKNKSIQNTQRYTEM